MPYNFKFFNLKKRRKSHKIKTAKWLKGKGIEIGPYKTPIDGIKPFYVDKFREFANEPCLADIYSEACELPFKTNSIDYVAASHVIEHIANPVAAICEWYRVLRPGGIIYIVVPDRRFTWDRHRQLTPCEHLFDDYAGGITDCDATHIDDFVDNIAWSEFDSSVRAEELNGKKMARKKHYHETVKAGRIINIHFHVFEPVNVITLLDQLNRHPETRLQISLVDCVERFPASSPNGFLIVARVKENINNPYEALKSKFILMKHRLRTILSQ